MEDLDDNFDDIVRLAEDIEVPEDVLVYTDSGEPYMLSPSDYHNFLIPLFRLDAIMSGTPRSRFNLARAQLDAVYDSPQWEGGDTCREAVDNLRRAVEQDPHPEPYALLGEALIKLYDFDEDEALLDEAVSALEEGITGRDNGRAYLFLGAAICAKAENTDDLHDKLKLYHEGISYIQFAKDTDGTAGDYWRLGDALGALAEYTSDMDERNSLMEQALENLRISYEMDGDRDTLRDIKELEEEAF